MVLKHILTGLIPGDHYKLRDYLSAMGGSYWLVLLDYSHHCDININKVKDNWKKIYLDMSLEVVMIEKHILILVKGFQLRQDLSNHVLCHFDKMEGDNIQKPFVIISDIFEELSQLQEVYQKLKGISNRKFFYDGSNGPIFYENINVDIENLGLEKFSPIEYIETIYNAILSKDCLLIDQVTKKLYQVLQNKDYTIEQTLQILINCMLQLKSLLNKTYIKEFVEISETELINEICDCSTLYEIIHKSRDKLIKFCNYIKGSSETDAIERVISYIDIHYNEDIKLERIAELFGYNSAYLGRLFSGRVGRSFNLYIDKKRLDKAIDMLINTDIKIPDISMLIGYQNVEYFYRKFKKYTSVTPGNYRDGNQVDKN